MNSNGVRGGSADDKDGFLPCFARVCVSHPGSIAPPRSIMDTPLFPPNVQFWESEELQEGLLDGQLLALAPGFWAKVSTEVGLGCISHELQLVVGST